MQKRKICVITGTRAEYGLLYWLMKDIKNSDILELQVIATGTHLIKEFGHTVDEIYHDGFDVNELVNSQVDGDSNKSMAKSLGLGIISMTDALDRLQPDIVILLGDRYEILAAAQSSSLLGFPIAHISGGELTSGAVDDWIRHSITKASWWHFVAAEAYQKRVIQLGENPERVFNVGDPGLDSIRLIEDFSVKEIEKDLNIKIKKPFFLVTFHPATLGEIDPSKAFEELLSALDSFPNSLIIMTKPNADAGSRKISDLAEKWTKLNKKRVRYISSLGQKRYLSLMKICSAVIGNSSSGIVEAPALKIPTVNIGPRQNGRLRASSIIDCSENTLEIVSSIETALSNDFQKSLIKTVSKYGDSNASKSILKILSSVSLPKTLEKEFYDH